MVPLPCFRVPSQTADPVRVAIVLFPLVFVFKASRENSFSAGHAGAGAASAEGTDSSRCCAFARVRCLRASQMLRAHHPTVIGTAIQLIVFRSSLRPCKPW